MIVDVHTHLYRDPDMDVEMSLSSQDVTGIARDYMDRLERGPVDYAIAIVMDDEFLLDDRAVADLLSVREESGSFSLAYLIDPRREDAAKQVIRAAETGAVGVKLHPYIHTLGPNTYREIKEVCKVIDENNLVTIIDCSYGSKSLYEANGVELGHSLAQTVSSPILLAHGGGPRVLDAFATAEAMNNVYVDTSFSLDYWEGSSVIQDYGFVANKIEKNRIMWGSDHPYVDQKQSLSRANSFFEKYVDTEKYSDREKNFFGKNAEKMIKI